MFFFYTTVTTPVLISSATSARSVLTLESCGPFLSRWRVMFVFVFVQMLGNFRASVHRHSISLQEVPHCASASVPC